MKKPGQWTGKAKQLLVRKPKSKTNKKRTCHVGVPRWECTNVTSSLTIIPLIKMRSKFEKVVFLKKVNLSLLRSLLNTHTLKPNLYAGVAFLPPPSSFFWGAKSFLTKTLFISNQLQEKVAKVTGSLPIFRHAEVTF